MNIEKRFDELRKQASDCAEAKAQVDYLEEFKKSKLAILMKEYEQKGITTASGQEREARADKEYIELLEGLKAARIEYEKLRWELEITKMRFEAWRSKQATNRAEMQLR